MRAARRAVHLVLLDHKRRGDPIAAFRDGRAVWIPADQIEVPEAPPDEPDAQAPSGI